MIHGVPKRLYVARTGRAFVNRPAGESVNHLKRKQLKVEHKLVRLKRNEAQVDNIVGKRIASRKRSEKASESFSSDVRFDITKQGGDV